MIGVKRKARKYQLVFNTEQDESRIQNFKFNIEPAFLQVKLKLYIIKPLNASHLK